MSSVQPGRSPGGWGHQDHPRLMRMRQLTSKLGQPHSHTPWEQPLVRARAGCTDWGHVWETEKGTRAPRKGSGVKPVGMHDVACCGSQWGLPHKNYQIMFWSILFNADLFLNSESTICCFSIKPAGFIVSMDSTFSRNEPLNPLWQVSLSGVPSSNVHYPHTAKLIFP